MWDWLFQFIDPLERSQVWFAAPEAVILHKLRFFRDGGGEKHLRDIRGMLTVSDDSIDMPAIAEACAKLDLTAAWMQAKATN